MRSPNCRRVLLGLFTATTLAVVSCSGDDDEDTAPSTTEAENETEAGTGAGVGADGSGGVDDPYEGHTSEVYDGTTNWLCHPDLDDDECRDLSATVIAGDGTRERQDFEVAEDPPVDCFYVYPTVSLDSGLSSDLSPGEPERLTVGAQASLFATECRLFAPVYRQVTVNGLGTSDQAARAMAYDDVVDAWKTYVSQHNEGRGVVLIGHSQGASVLRRLVQEEIDAAPALRERLVSAILLGSTVTAPDGEDVGGSFENVPACRTPDQVGCVVTYASYPAGDPPPENGIFGRADDETGERALCVDPVALSGDDGGRADAIAPSTMPFLGALPVQPPVDTRYVVMPDLLEASCERQGPFDYFAAGGAAPDDARPVGSLTGLSLGPDWGLHLHDVNLALGNLLELVAAQAEAYAG